MNLFNIRSWADARAFLYVLLPVISTLLVGDGVLTNDTATLWTALVTAVLGPVIAAFNAHSVSAFRTAFYALLGAGQALAIGYNLATQSLFDHWLPLVVAVIGFSAGGVSAANTDTTPAAG